MWLPLKQNFFTYFLCALVTTTSVAGQICNFDNYACNWEIGVWDTSNEAYVDYAPYPDFTASHPSGDGPTFLFAQNAVGTTRSITTFNIPAQGTIISFDYFFDLPNGVPYSNYDYLSIAVSNVDGSFTTTIVSPDLYSPSPIWQHHDSVCDESFNFCCGSADKVPCFVTFIITNSLNPINVKGLFAIDNIGIAGSEVTTAAPTTAVTTEKITTKEPTTVAPTTAAPTTAAPTTVAPTTTAPTTAVPTTAVPTTVEPTTAVPTTVEPTTAEPTTVEPTTAVPTTVEPTTAVPTTVEPTTAEPTTVEPTTAVPTTVEPTTMAPTTVVPTTVVPTTLEPTTAEPTTEEPTTAEPTTEDPTTPA